LCCISRHNPLLEPLMAAFAPLVMASFIGASFYSPMRALEETVAIVLLSLQLGYIIGLCVICMLILILPTYAVVGSIPWHLLGIFAGEVGLALVGYRLLGAERSWAMPLVYVAGTYYAYITDYNGFSSMLLPAWMWPVRLIITLDSLLWQMGFLLIGVAALVTSASDDVVSDALS